MKSLAELEAIRQQTLNCISLRREDAAQLIRVVVGMGTCGIAAGARPVMLTFLDEVGKRGLRNVTVSQMGCAGNCALEPVVDVYLPGKEKVTYVHMTPEKAVRVMDEHIGKGQPVAEYMIGAAENQ